MLALVEIPKHGDTVLAARSSQGPIGGNSDGVDIACVAIVVGLELELGEFPNLQQGQRCARRNGSSIKDGQRSWWKI